MPPFNRVTSFLDIQSLDLISRQILMVVKGVVKRRQGKKQRKLKMR
jgi:hypothetical protein